MTKLHPSNILGNPVSTILGAMVAGQAAAPLTLPHNTAGWIGFGLQIAMGLLGIFA